LLLLMMMIIIIISIYALYIYHCSRSRGAV